MLDHDGNLPWKLSVEGGASFGVSDDERDPMRDVISKAEALGTSAAERAEIQLQALSGLKTKRVMEWIATCKERPQEARRALMQDFRSSANDILFCVDASIAGRAGGWHSGVGAKIIPQGIHFIDGQRNDEWIIRSVVEREGEVKGLCQHYRSRQFAIGTLDIDEAGRGNIIVEDFPAGETMLALQRISQLLHAPEGIRWTGDRVDDWYSADPSLDAALRQASQTHRVRCGALTEAGQEALTLVYADESKDVKKASEQKAEVLSLFKADACAKRGVPMLTEPTDFEGADGRRYLATQYVTASGIGYDFAAIGEGGQLEPVYYDQVSNTLLTNAFEDILRNRPQPTGNHHELHDNDEGPSPG